MHTTTTMSANPRFYGEPLRYLKWASINKPAYFYSIVVGLMGPAVVVAVPPIRRYLGEEPIAKIPLTYPIPKGERPRPTGFDDE
ncbi:n19m, NADH-ubiquinone oxidoreductase 9.5 kDa subunit [Didymella pomorum]